MSKTKKKIAEVFKELVGKKAFAKITITDIARECHMTRENFYYHFRDKYDIVSWIFREEVARQVERKDLPFPEWFLLLLHQINQDYSYYRKVCKAMEMTLLEREFHDLLSHKIQKFVNATINMPSWASVTEKEEFVVEFFTMSFENWMIQYILSNERMEEEKLGDNLRYLFDHFLSFVRNSKSL